MRKVMVALILAAGMCLATAGWSQAQDSQPMSLGDLARKLREQRPQAKTDTKVFTNDTIPKQGGLVDSSASASDSGSTGTTGSDQSATGKNGAAKSGEHNEKYYRDQMAELQSTKAMHERELSVLEQKLSLNQTQYYSDPNKTLNQEFSRGDINKKQDEIDAKKKQIEEDQKAIDDLQAQCQREGCPASWLR